jgi:hypothetical protein
MQRPTRNNGSTVGSGLLYGSPPSLYHSTSRVVRVEVGSNTYTVALRVVGGDKKGAQCLGVKLGHPVPGGYK